MTNRDADDMRMNQHAWLDDPGTEEVRETRMTDAERLLLLAGQVPTSVGIETLDECIRRLRVICSHAACPMVCDLPGELE